jgi:hypothetical protein
VCNHSGATMARLLRACRSVSLTTSLRFNARMAARIWVESVRWRPPALTRWRSRHHVSNVSKSKYSAAPVMRRVRNSLRTEASNPASVSSRPRTYFQSMRLRTACAAWRSDSPSANCRSVTNASRQGGLSGLSMCGQACQKGVIREQCLQFIGHTQVPVALGKRSTGDPGCFGWDRLDRQRAKHGAPPHLWADSSRRRWIVPVLKGLRQQYHIMAETRASAPSAPPLRVSRVREHVCAHIQLLASGGS